MQKQFDVILTELLCGQTVTPPSDAGVVLAVSGGVDSMCMADLFLHSALKPAFALAHCNFHLRGEESDGDEAFVTDWAAENGVKLHKTDFDTLGYAAEHGLSIEMAARELRYRWFAGLCDRYGYSAVAVAHNANDNAETLVLNLVRGTGLRGLSGIRASSPIPFVEKGLVIRPMLGFTRKQIEGYAMSHGIRWREDSTNASGEYKRNKVRNSVFPVFEELNPSFVKTFNREMSYFSEAGDIVEEYCRVQAAGISEKQDGILKVDVAGLTSLGHWRSVLYHILEQYGFNSSVVSSVADLLDSSRTISGKSFFSATHEILTASGKLIIRKKDMRVPDFDRVYAVRGPVPSAVAPVKAVTSMDDPIMVVRGAGNYRFNGVSFIVEVNDYTETTVLKMPPGSIIFDADRLQFPFVCRRWRNGDWFRPLGLKGKKKVSDLFTDLKYNLMQKESAIIIADPNRKGTADDVQSHISAVLGVRIDDSLKVTDATRRVVTISII